MPFSFFTIPARDPAPAAGELNGFLRGHKVLAIDRRWADAGADSFWAVCVDDLDHTPATPGGPRPGPGKNKVDDKELLTPEEFAVFARLRDVRAEAAKAAAVPVYAVFTNEPLADVVRSRAATKAALGKIDGVGEARVAKYGDRALGVLCAAWGATGEAGREPV